MGAALPPWLDPLPDAEQMRTTDKWAIEERGVPSLDLMERAAEGLAGVVAERAGDGPVAVVCGKGNNGGDGLAAARLLREGGREVSVLLLAAPGEYEGDAAANLRRLPGAAAQPFDPGALASAAVVVDAMLGTGFSGAPRDPVAGAIEAVNAASAPVVAADVPSGVDASAGRVEGAAVRAAATATFHRPKPGLYVAPGKAHAGEVTVVDIGIPVGAPAAATAGLIAGSVLESVPRRQPGSTKFSEGAVLVVGGSAGLTGAPCLAGEAAARAGAGYVTAAVPGSLALVFELRLLEAMTRALPDRAGALSAGALEPALAAAERADALVLGPGAGREPETAALVRELAARCEQPLLVDADGLNAHADRLEAPGHPPARRPSSRRTPASSVACWAATAPTCRPIAWAAREPRRGSPLRGGPQGRRHPGRPARRSGRGQRGRIGSAGHCRHRRRAVGCDRGHAGQGPARVRRRLRRSAPARPGRRPGRAASAAPTG